ncbi:uncharacterized protein [Aristolochia californica]|uniref:uncharacterized protein n=1 Tax=Aristolochia californica TaxID=171875 RepID=UPI0035DAF505
MNSMQISACPVHVEASSMSPLSLSCYLPSSRLCISPLHSVYLLPNRRVLVCTAKTYQRCNPVCLFGGKGKQGNENEPNLWKSLEKAMGGLKQDLTVQDVLREQIQSAEFGDDGGYGDVPGGGGRGGGDGPGEDEGLAGIFDELLQVVLAIIGFIFVYIYIIRGEELTRLAKDYIRYLFGAAKSVRLRRAMYVWGRFCKRMTRKKEVKQDWLEHAIRTTPTWWYNPRVYRRVKVKMAEMGIPD